MQVHVMWSLSSTWNCASAQNAPVSLVAIFSLSEKENEASCSLEQVYFHKINTF